MTVRGYKSADAGTLTRALKKALATLKKENVCIASEHDAGFVLSNPDSKTPAFGFQIFVRACRYSETLRREDPNSGGLYECITEPRPKPKPLGKAIGALNAEIARFTQGIMNADDKARVKELRAAVHILKKGG